MSSPAYPPRAAASLTPARRVVVRLAAVTLFALAGLSGCGKDPAGEAEGPPAPTPGNPEPPAVVPNAGTDVDGVVKLYADAPGMHFVLGDADPNTMAQLVIEEGVRAVAGQENNLSFWSVDTYAFEYTEGRAMGKTARLHIREAGAEQLYDWQTQKGFLADTGSLGDQELTALVRVRGLSDPEHAVFELKIRGGEHTEDDPPLASCSLMTFATRAAPGVSRFGKELDHPQYDYVNLPPRIGAELVEGRWFGLKLVSYTDPARTDRVYNQLFVDVEPLLADGSLRNEYHLLAEYVDRAGVSTGRYDMMVSWKGYQTTLRIDGVDTLDVARLSARAITPPNAAPNP